MGDKGERENMEVIKEREGKKPWMIKEGVSA